MKFWLKILLISLFFVLGAVESTAFIVLSHDFSMTVERERERGVSEHHYLAATISNQVTYSRITDDKVLLTPEEIAVVIDDVVSEMTLSVHGLMVELEGDPVSAFGMEALFGLEEFRIRAQESESCLTIISGMGEDTCLYISSGIDLEGTRYQLYTAMDMGELYLDYDEQLVFVRNVGLVLSVVISVVLMAVQFTLLGPLTKVNNGLRAIARGNYSLRIKEKGSAEFRELAGNINRMTNAVEDNVERISEIAESRKRFIDNLAHEMKTPLTSIMGFGDLMRIQRQMSEKQRREYAEIIVEEAKRLKTLSGKLLELATNDSTELEMEAVSLRELFREVYLTVAPILAKRRMEMDMYCAYVEIDCDRELFKSLLYNLIDNSIKASAENGKILLEGKQEGDMVRISVTDFGIGMSEDQLKRVIEPFYMVDKSRSRRQGGAGLGLSLCSEIAKRHQTSLRIVSEPGEGTAVWLELPCRQEVAGEENHE